MIISALFSSELSSWSQVGVNTVLPSTFTGELKLAQFALIGSGLPQ